MARARSGQTSFTSGELSPNLFGRIEVSRYYGGAALLRNVLVIPQGGVKRRPGMAHRTALGDGLDGIRMIPFAFNTEQTYAIGLTAGGFHVWTSDGTYRGFFGSAPWTGAQAAQMNFAQSADTLLLFHPDVQSQRIRRGASHTIWNRDALPYANIPTHDFGSGAEAVISGTRGWPECGTFHQGRLWVGGFRSRPSTMMASKVADYFNFDRGTSLDDEAIYVTIDSDQVNAIYQMRSGRTLQVFTSGAAFAPTVDPPYTPTNFNLNEQTRRGIKRFTHMSEVDGATIFVGRGGAALRQFLYDEVEAAYRADLLSLLSPQLIRDPSQLAMRRGQAGDDADHMLVVNADGQASVLTTLRAQEITAFSRWETDGTILSAAALESGEVFFAVNRAGVVQVETWESGRLLDSGQVRTDVTPFASITGLAHLNGRTVHMVADGAYLGTATVSAGSVTLPRAALTAEAGLLFTPRIETLPLEPRDPTGALPGRVSRIARATARVVDTATFTLQGRKVIYRQIGAGAPVFGTAPPRLTGDVTVRGIAGWRQRHTLTIEQPVPGPMTLLSLSYDLGIGA
jgi:hypothetical protein